MTEETHLISSLNLTKNISEFPEICLHEMRALSGDDIYTAARELGTGYRQIDTLELGKPDNSLMRRYSARYFNAASGGDYVEY